MENSVIYNTDAFAKLKEIPDHSVDLILTDPPPIESLPFQGVFQCVCY
ncbi:MAG: hypothetical protein LBP89_03290 [Helicobacteraceae bacterium]|jgi:DNA modification methylase|nr:hypothetical protein [Helicobacteraceae bacterium]